MKATLWSRVGLSVIMVETQRMPKLFVGTNITPNTTQECRICEQQKRNHLVHKYCMLNIFWESSIIWTAFLFLPLFGWYLFEPRQLGYLGGNLTIGSHFGKVSEDFGRDNVQCNGTEDYIWRCPHETEVNCTRDEGMGVICSGVKSMGPKWS